MEVKTHLSQTISDLGTAGTIGGILTLIGTYSTGVQTLITLGIPALGCMYNLGNRIITEKIATKDREKIEKLHCEIATEMQKRNIQELNRFVEFDFSTEEFVMIEELVKHSINAKNNWTRRLASSFLVTIGSKSLDDLIGLQRCVSILAELDEIDVKLLYLHLCVTFAYLDPEKVELEFSEIKNELLADKTVFAQSIRVSSAKLESLGLVMRGCSRYPYDDERGNKPEMIDDFLSKNRNEVTMHCQVFQRFLKGTIKDS